MDTKKNTLLIVDDTPANLVSLSSILQDEYDIYAAASGEMALQQAARYIPDLILLDIMMPDMDGFEVLSRLRTQEITAEIPVIFITGLRDTEDEDEGFRRGAADYIKRPFNPAIVRHRVHNQIHIVNLRRDLEDALKTAREASRAKTDFLANMSHEIRTPMNVIAGLTELLLEGDCEGDELRENLSKISTAGTTLLGIINDVLDISKIEAGKLALNPVRYDTAELLSDIINVNSFRIGDKPVVFRPVIDDNLYSELFGDDLRIKQILNNLLSNAFKYTNEGEVILRISAGAQGNGECIIDNGELRDGDNGKCIIDNGELRDGGNGKCIIDNGELRDGDEESNDNNYQLSIINYQLKEDEDDDVVLSIEVRDTGIGIREEDLKKLFTDYNRVDTQANRRIEGTGLGLAITKNLIELMGGEISVTSKYGEGSVFRVKIRQKYVSGKRIGIDTAERLQTFRYIKAAGAVPDRPDLSHAAVLVVDDFPMNLDVARGLLGKYKLKVDCVAGGREAIDRIKAGTPAYSAVFMDHMMPEMDGIEATRRIRALGTEYAASVPIIALTANAIAGNEQMFLENGFQAFLSKPVNRAKIDAVIRRWIAGGGQADTEAAGNASNAETGAGEATGAGEVTGNEQKNNEATGADTLPETKPAPADSTINIKGINAAAGLELYEGDIDMYAYIMQSFTDNMPAELGRLREVTEQNLREYAIGAHTIKGSAASIGADHLTQTAKKMEMLAKAGDYTAVKDGNAELINETQALIDNLTAWLGSRRKFPK